MMNLSHWRLIVAIADTGTITRGAERVGMTQSGASQALAQMEETLGAPLFARSRRDVSMTAFGDAVVEHARGMLASLNAIGGLADEQKGIGSGRLRLASFPSVISTRLPALLGSFRQRHPGIDIVALEGTDEEVETWLASGAIDLGVVLNPTPERQALILGCDAWVAVVPTAHPMARRASARGVDFAELATQPFILATGGCAVNAQHLAQERGVALSNIRVTVRDWVSACVLVREGMGVAIVPESTLPEDKRGLRVLSLTQPIYRRFGLVPATATPVLKLVETFWQHVANHKTPP
ncbi:LysR family transcriptional regulator [Halomonas sp. ATBC28]|jgi:DNA-binding transcriptional LysR family regulator|uniref:LysR family transcriptional regulator n=1 Tax=Vreelandella sedimenti TaxID=2729618 RepID=A0A7Z0N6R6_9GAMM|nr:MULTISPECIES: LysR family transcriptional regulator [Halomonas]NYT72214.1 LysR family transcriptional regulator [Halomonas sedimenti]TMU17620.1 LysR family transcriptional regulator [Halomonas sp. ATBC28]|tara:strand:+ start:5530 stop:6414 length:885 start_codon:yes stop_codon:yes gene_type:complete